MAKTLLQILRKGGISYLRMIGLNPSEYGQTNSELNELTDEEILEYDAFIEQKNKTYNTKSKNTTK